MFNDSLESLAGASDFESFATDKNAFRESLLKHIGLEQNGMVVDDICLHHLQKI
ncbi:MAG: hypothetical protein AB8B55_16200 [Mariniblastus sp.]